MTNRAGSALLLNTYKTVTRYLFLTCKIYRVLYIIVWSSKSFHTFIFSLKTVKAGGVVIK